MMTRLDRVLVTKCYDAITAIAEGQSEIVPDEAALNSIRNPFDGGKGTSKLKAPLAFRSVMENEVLIRISNRLFTQPNFSIRYYPQHLNEFFYGLTTFFISANGFIKRDEKNNGEAILTCSSEELEHLKDDFENTKAQFEEVEYFFYDIFRVYEEDAVEEILRDATELLKNIIAAFDDSKKSKLQYSITFDLSSLLNRVRAIVAEVENEQEIQLYDLIYSPEERLALAYLIRKHGVKKDMKLVHSSNAMDESEEPVSSIADDTGVYSLDDLTLKKIQDDKQLIDANRIPIRPEKRSVIVDWFRKLVASNKLSASDAAYWICAEFSGFKKLEDTTRRVSPKMIPTHQMYFVRHIQKECDFENRRSVPRFRAMLKRRLTAFDDKSDANIKNHFSHIIKHPDSIFH